MWWLWCSRHYECTWYLWQKSQYGYVWEPLRVSDLSLTGSWYTRLIFWLLHRRKIGCTLYTTNYTKKEYKSGFVLQKTSFTSFLQTSHMVEIYNFNFWAILLCFELELNNRHLRPIALNFDHWIATYIVNCRYEVVLDEVKPQDLSFSFLKEFMELPTSYFAARAPLNIVSTSSVAWDTSCTNCEKASLIHLFTVSAL